MERIAQFYKVSLEQFQSDWADAFPGTDKDRLRDIYEEIKLPRRATSGSAGYDFFTPDALVLSPGETVKLPTGIRARMEEGWVLQIFPRSSLGFKFRLQLNNTVGIIDSDYFYSDNQGHMFIKMTNNTNEGRVVELPAGTGFAQGIFLPFGITVDDGCSSSRNGGMGSTDAR